VDQAKMENAGSLAFVTCRAIGRVGQSGPVYPLQQNVSDVCLPIKRDEFWTIVPWSILKPLTVNCPPNMFAMVNRHGPTAYSTAATVAFSTRGVGIYIPRCRIAEKKRYNDAARAQKHSNGLQIKRQTSAATEAALL
jgi:hypothetical protein